MNRQELLWRSALRLEELAEPDLARDLFSLLQQDPMLEPVLRANVNLRLGLLLRAQGDPGTAESHYLAAIQSGIASVAWPARAGYASLLFESGRYAEAADQYLAASASAQESGVEDFEYLLLATISALRAGTHEKIPPDLLNRLCPAGYAASPSLQGLWRGVAGEAATAGLHVLANQLWERFLTLSGPAPDARDEAAFALAQGLEALGDLPASAAHFREIALGNSTLSLASRLRAADLYSALEENERVIELLKPLLDSGEERGRSAQIQLQYAKARMREREWAEAEPWFQKVSQKFSGTQFALAADSALAEIGIARKQLDQAKQALSRVIDNPETDPVTRAAAALQMARLR